MPKHGRWRWCTALFLLPATTWLLVAGCQAISNRLTKWQMLGSEALQDPIAAVGGDGMVFTPREKDTSLDRRELARASPARLVNYFSPIFVQQRIDTRSQRHPYPPEYDEIGTAQLRHKADGKLEAFVAGAPCVYGIVEKRTIGGQEHIQLTYTAWYPAHPRMKTIDLEEAKIDSCVVRVTLDADHAPLFYETIAACGCFHKVFVERWLEDAASRAFGPPEKEKKYSVERYVKDAIDWEVAGVIEETRDTPRRPVVFIKAGDHKVLGMGSAARLRVPAGADVRPYQILDYSKLYAVQVENSNETAPFFDLKKGGKVWGAERKESILLSVIGVDAAGQPRANDQIKLHFDQSTWGDPTIYEQLPPFAGGYAVGGNSHLGCGIAWKGRPTGTAKETRRAADRSPPAGQGVWQDGEGRGAARTGSHAPHRRVRRGDGRIRFRQEHAPASARRTGRTNERQHSPGRRRSGRPE